MSGPSAPPPPPPPSEKENLEILSKDDVEMQKAKREKLAARMAKNGYGDLVMSTEGISLNILLRMQHLTN